MSVGLRSLLLLAVALGLGACAGTTPDETAHHEHPHEHELSASTSVRALGASMGLSQRPRAGRSQIVLGHSEGSRVVLFPGSSTAIVRGVKLTLGAEVDERHGAAYVTRADAARIRSAWRAGAPRSSGGMGALPPPPPPTPPSVVIQPVESLAGASASRRLSAAERRRWAVPLRRDWRYIVVHHSASATGSADVFHRAHLDRGWDGLGYDFVIGNGRGSGDGEVEVGYRWTQQKVGAHAGNDLMNQKGIGICLVGDFTKQPPTRRQMDSLQRLCDFLADYCGIPEQNLRLHRDVRQTKCPGPLFPTAFRISSRPTGAAISVR